VLRVSLLATPIVLLLLLSLPAMPTVALLVLLLSLLVKLTKTLPLDQSMGIVHLFQLRVTVGLVLPQRLGNGFEYRVVAFQLAIYFTRAVKAHKALGMLGFAKRDLLLQSCVGYTQGVNYFTNVHG